MHLSPSSKFIFQDIKVLLDIKDFDEVKIKFKRLK
jgi:hypothetical protein